MKSKNGKILDVTCNNSLSIPLITAKKIVLFIEVLKYCFSQSLECFQDPQPHFTLNLK